MLDFIFAFSACVLLFGLLLSPVSPELTLFFIKDKSLQTRGVAVSFYFLMLLLYTLVNMIFSWIL